RHTRFSRDWSSDVCSSDLIAQANLLDERLKVSLFFNNLYSLLNSSNILLSTNNFIVSLYKSSLSKIPLNVNGESTSFFVAFCLVVLLCGSEVVFTSFSNSWILLLIYSNCTSTE